MRQSDAGERSRLTLWQWLALRELHRRAGKGGGEPLSSEDWAALWQLHDTPVSRAMTRLWTALPHSPRCGMCGAPFAGPGRWLVRPLGYRPSRKNPTICAVCVESSPPGGMKMYAGILSADIRGFTARTEGADPEAVSNLLRRFYRCAEDVLFPDAIIDKLVGDEVMALYLPDIQKRISRSDVPALMLEHARGLLRKVGYGLAREPFVEMGIGIDFGEAFVGNIGERALYDFTAVGDAVNTASRLQKQAAAGEILLSQRVANGLPMLVGTPVKLSLKGISEPQTVYRVRI